MNSRLNFVRALLIACCIGSHTFAALPLIPEDPQAAQIWRANRVGQMKEFQEKSAEEAIAGIGAMLGQLTRLKYRDCRERDEIISLSQSALLAIPGHAEYYAKAIEVEREKAIGHNGPGQPPYWHGYDQSRSWYFQTLKNLPSVETVKVLGDFLYDERDVQPEEYRKAHPEDQRGIGPNANCAAGALNSLGIVSSLNGKPRGRAKFNDVESWRLWFEQVKAGTRTFGFENDPQEYNLQGPVSVATAPMTSRPDKRSAASEGVATENAEKAFPLPAWIAAGLALAVAGWWILRGRGKRMA